MFSLREGWCAPALRPWDHYARRRCHHRRGACWWSAAVIAALLLPLSAQAQERPRYSDYLLPVGLQAIYGGNDAFIGRVRGFDRGVRVAYVLGFARHLHETCRSFGEAGAQLDEVEQTLQAWLFNGEPHPMRLGVIRGAKYAKADFRDWRDAYPVCGSEQHREVEAGLRRMLPLEPAP